MSRFGKVRSTVLALLAMIGLMVTALPASADDGDLGDDNPPDDYTAEVEADILIDGDTIPGENGRVRVTVPAKCVWKVVSENPKTFKILMIAGTVFSFGLWGLQSPGMDVMNEAIEEWDDGEKTVKWYYLDCQDGTDPEYVQSYIRNCALLFPDACIPSPFAYFVDNEEPPVVIEPEELALAAKERLQIPEPEVDRNPKAADLNQATLVNVPTWFWVMDPDSVGGKDGQLSVRASIPEMSVWAEVTATTGGLTLSSPAGGTQCAPQKALRQWASGANDGDGCTVEFERASVNHPSGYPVTAETQWTAAWVGEGADGVQQSGDLPPATAQETVNVPVAEVQGVGRQ